MLINRRKTKRGARMSERQRRRQKRKRDCLGGASIRLLNKLHRGKMSRESRGNMRTRHTVSQYRSLSFCTLLRYFPGHVACFPARHNEPARSHSFVCFRRFPHCCLAVPRHDTFANEAGFSYQSLKAKSEIYLPREYRADRVIHNRGR